MESPCPSVPSVFLPRLCVSPPSVCFSRVCVFFPGLCVSVLCVFVLCVFPVPRPCADANGVGRICRGCAGVAGAQVLERVRAVCGRLRQRPRGAQGDRVAQRKGTLSLARSTGPAFASHAHPLGLTLPCVVVDRPLQRFRGRELRSIELDDATTAADGDLKIFERLTFVSAAIWMGAVVFFILLFVIIPAILCTMEIQGPNQFEKKPLLNTAQ